MLATSQYKSKLSSISNVAPGRSTNQTAVLTSNSIIYLYTCNFIFSDIVDQSLPTTDNSWYIFNLQQNGVYRVNYDMSNWLALIDTLKQDHKVCHLS